LQSEKNIRVIISGGGTGGHIFPAIAIANALKSINSSIDILFVGAEGKMEMEKVPAAGYEIKGLPIAGIKREVSINNLSFPLKLLKSLRKANSIIKEFNPQIAIGVGGYASGPLLYMASRRGVPTLIQEQNSYPGITNKLLAKKARKICVAYENMNQFFPAEKIVFTGNPVRNDIQSIEGKKAEAASFFGLDVNKQTILIVGGSQGARSINKAIKAGLNKIHQSGIQIIWQTGKIFKTEAEEALKEFPSNKIKSMEFISRMDFAYAMADVVITRGGASTVSELCIVQKPAILIPLPTAAEDHQTKNCKALVERNAAMLITDQEAGTILVDEAIALLGNKERCEAYAKNIAPLGRPTAAIDIANEILQIIKTGK